MQPINRLTHDFSAMRLEYIALAEKIPRLVGILGKKIMRENFDAQGFKEAAGAVSAWRPRSPVTNSIYDSRSGVQGSVYNSRNPILRQTGNLYNSITYRISGKEIAIGCNLNQVPYAKLMNEGGRVRFGHQTKYVPARKFIGYSSYFSNSVRDMILAKRNEIFNRFRLP